MLLRNIAMYGQRYNHASEMILIQITHIYSCPSFIRYIFIIYI